MCEGIGSRSVMENTASREPAYTESSRQERDWYVLGIKEMSVWLKARELREE